MSNLVGRNILIVDEVDDTRTTLEYAVRELEKDVETARQKLGREAGETRFSIFVLHVSLDTDQFLSAQILRGSLITKLTTSSRTRISRRRGTSHQR